MSGFTTSSNRAAIIAALFLLAVCGLLATEAAAHDNETNSVSESEYLSLKDQTKWSIAAYSRWDKLNCRWSSTCNGVDVDVVVEATPRVAVVDVNVCGVTWGGYYRTSYNPDQIQLNDCNFKRYSRQSQNIVIGHEIGHALDFAHTPCSEYWSRVSVMAGGCDKPEDWPAKHDVSDYKQRWID